MKKSMFQIAGACMFLLVLTSCGGGGSKLSSQSPNEEGFAKIQEALVEKFGAAAYYEDIHVDYTVSDYDDPELSVYATTTNDSTSRNLEEWSRSAQHDWQHDANVSMRISDDSAPVDFLFQLNSTFDFKKVGKMVEDATKVLSAEAKLEGAILKTARMCTPDDDVAAETKVYIRMTTKDNRPTYIFTYGLDGKLLAWRDESAPIES